MSFSPIIVNIVYISIFEFDELFSGIIYTDV